MQLRLHLSLSVIEWKLDSWWGRLMDSPWSISNRSFGFAIQELYHRTFLQGKMLWMTQSYVLSKTISVSCLQPLLVRYILLCKRWTCLNAFCRYRWSGVKHHALKIVRVIVENDCSSFANNRGPLLIALHEGSVVPVLLCF